MTVGKVVRLSVNWKYGGLLSCFNNGEERRVPFMSQSCGRFGYSYDEGVIDDWPLREIRLLKYI